MNKKKVFLSLLGILSLLLGADYLGLFDPKWKKYSLESPYVDEYGEMVSRKTKTSKINPLYEKMNIKGLVYHYDVKEVIHEEGGRGSPIDEIELICSIDAYSLSKPRSLTELNNISDEKDYYVSYYHKDSVMDGYMTRNESYYSREYYNSLHNRKYNEIKNAFQKNPQADFHIYGRIIEKDEYYKSIRKKTDIYSKWLPANTLFAINAENIFEKIDDNGKIIDKISALSPQKWKPLESCLKYLVGNKKDMDTANIRHYKTMENFLSKDNHTEFRNKIIMTIFSDKSFIMINDKVTCSSDYEMPEKSFGTGQKSFIDIYNIDEKMYIRIYSIYDKWLPNWLPYISRYCEE